MFHEIFLAPFRQTKKFRSPDVALLPFVSGSTHAVMTPLWTPGLLAVRAPAIAVTVANETTAAAASSSFVERDFIRSSFPESLRGEDVRSSDSSASQGSRVATTRRINRMGHVPTQWGYVPRGSMSLVDRRFPVRVVSAAFSAATTPTLRRFTVCQTPLPM